MVVEHFKEGNAKPVYQRFQAKGRLAPDGLKYISSWISRDFKICFQIMETDDRNLITQWIKNWEDIVDFEVFPVITSEEATKQMWSK